MWLSGSRNHSIVLTSNANDESVGTRLHFSGFATIRRSEIVYARRDFLQPDSGPDVERNIERRRESSALNGVGDYTFHLQRRGCAIVAVASER
jgi:hypothetical protein